VCRSFTSIIRWILLQLIFCSPRLNTTIIVAGISNACHLINNNDLLRADLNAGRDAAEAMSEGSEFHATIVLGK
jgi:hypothetical protein